MKLSKFEELIINNSSKYNIEKGKELLKNKELLKLNVHKNDYIYNIYGSFKKENSNEFFSSHLKIDTKNEKIISCRCGCDYFLDISKNDKNIYMCKHLYATGFKFTEAAKANLKKKSPENIKKNILNKLYYIDEIKNINNSVEKTKLTLSISIKEVVETNGKNFDISLYINNEHSYPVLSINEWLNSYFNKEEYIIGKGLIYTYKKYYFSKEDKELLEYLYEYSCEFNSNKSTVRVSNKFLRRLFSKLIDRKVKLIFNSTTYLCNIKKSDLPLFFTLKQMKDKYILTTRKNHPIPLNDRFDVFMYDKDIYIPSSEQIEIYKVLFNELKNKNVIEINKNISIEELKDLLAYLNIAGEKINLDNNIIEIINKNTEVILYFKKQSDRYICNAVLICDHEEVDYKTVINDRNLYEKYGKKIRIIESELNKNRFYYRNETFEFLGTDDEYYDFLKYGIKNLNNIAKINISNNDNFFNFKKIEFSDFSLNINRDNKYDFSFKLDKINEYDFKNIIKEYKDSKSYIKLSDGSYIDLNNTEISNILDIFSILNIESEKSILDINKLYYLNEKIKDNKSFLEVRKNLENVIKEITDIGELKFTIPDDLNGNLRGYQMEGYKWFKSLSYFNLGGILADEMGLGKTIQTITFLLSEKLKKSLVVVPTSLIYNWISEFNKFAPALKIGIVYGDAKERKKIIQDSDKYNILITTYGLLKNDIDDYKEINFEYLILDEGQNINNYKTQTAKVVREINSSIRFVLTGTPIENNLIELWSIFDFIMPGYLYSKDEFTRKFLKDDKNMLEELKLLISPYILKRNKKDVLKELPDKIENKVLVTLPKKQKELYDSLLLEIKNKINNEREKENTIELFSYLMKLRQMCLDPSLILESYSGNNGKLNVTEEIIEKNINEHKIVIFSQFTSMLKRIEEKIKYKNINYVYLDGSTSAKKRIELVEQFNNDENIRIFLISLKAGGTGLNLTSSDIVIHFDPWYNPGVHDQASDRAHRIGQKRVVNIYKLIAKDTIEETIYLMQEYKKNLINEVLENDDITDNDVLNRLSNEQIINIILR